MNRFLPLLCAGMAVVSFFTCSTMGPSTEEGNPQIMATVVDDSQSPINGAVMTVYIIPENSDTSREPDSGIIAAVRLTDAVGACSFDNLPKGNYSLSAFDSANNRSAMISNIVVSGSKSGTPDYSDTIVLVAPGSITGVVSRGGVIGTGSNQNLNNGFIQVKIGEIDRSTVTGPNGKYSFTDLPPGVYSLFYYATDGFYSSKREDIHVSSGVDTTLDTVILRPVPRLVPPQGLTAVYDTIAGIMYLRWQKVVFDSLRWYEVERVNLSVPHDTIFICNDTLFIDTLAGMSSGTILDYVVRSVDKAFNKSANAGPVEITVKE